MTPRCSNCFKELVLAPNSTDYQQKIWRVLMSYKVKFCSLLCDTENRETIEARKSEIKRAKEEEARRFYSSPEWGALRIRVLAKYGRVCAACGRTDGRMHIDHIYPRSKYPHLALDFNNLQVLCEECNIGKSNTLIHDFRDEIAV